MRKAQKKSLDKKKFKSPLINLLSLKIPKKTRKK